MTMGFFPEHVKMLLGQGHSVEIATNCEQPLPEVYKSLGCKSYDIPFSRSPFSKNNVTAYRQLRALVEKEHYDIVHCHTPNAAMITRLACRKVRKQGTRVFYTAHGFHFFKGAPLKNWLMYYPVEKICARWTDVLITINHEDYELAQKKMPAKKVCYVPGVGIDLSKIQSVECNRAEVRKYIGVPEDCVLLFSVGELNSNKNHQVVVKALAQLNNLNVHYAIAGVGDQKEKLLALAESLGVKEQLHLLGFRTDVLKLYKAADIFVFPSFREGLSVSMMEAMATGLPIVCSRIRGNVDLVVEEKGGLHFVANDHYELCEKLEQMLLDTSVLKECGKFNSEYVNSFSISNVLKLVRDVYLNF